MVVYSCGDIVGNAVSNLMHYLMKILPDLVFGSRGTISNHFRLANAALAMSSAFHRFKLRFGRLQSKQFLVCLALFRNAFMRHIKVNGFLPCAFNTVKIN